MNKLVTLSCIFCLVLISSCELDKPQAYGKATEIMVIIDDVLWEDVKPELSAALEKEIYTVGREPIFEYAHVDPGNKKFKELRKWKYVAVIGSLESSKVLQDELFDEVKQKITPDQGFLYVTDDVWAKKQTVFFFVAATDEGIRTVVKANANALIEKLDEVFVAFQKTRMFASGINDSLEIRLAEKYGFTLHIPKIYSLFAENPKSLKIGTTNPDRTFVVYWEDAQRPDVTQKGVIELREKMATVYYPGDAIVMDRTRISEKKFNGYPTIYVQGVWENKDQVTGGVFYTYAMNCPEADRFYMIDATLYAPGKRKYAYLIQLNEILNSFQCNPDPDQVKASLETTG